MNTENTTEQGYGKFAKILHWVMAIMVITLLIVGSYMADLDKTDPMKREIMGMHKSFGAIFLMLALIRLVWSRINNSPKLPTILAPWEKLLSKTVTGSMYLLMIAIPFSGYAMTNLFGFPVSLFGIIDLPIIFSENREVASLAKEAHGILAGIIILAILAHIAGALKHRFIDAPEADVLPRMLPVKPRE